MGWLFQNTKLTHETPVAYVTRHFTHESDTTTATGLAAAAVRGTIYAAIRNQDRTTGKAFVFCAVILFRNNAREGFGYKTMDESVGPCEADCPDRILRLLSPVRLPQPVTFRSSGVTADTFRCIGHWKRTPVFAPLGHPELRCRLRRATLAQATITS